MKGDLTTLKALLARRVDVNRAQGDGMTALHWAARRNQADAASLLLDAGADVKAVTRIGGYTPLHLAAQEGADGVDAAAAARGAQAGAATTTGAVPLHFAAASGNVATISLLLDAGADPNAREPQWGQTPLMFAAGNGRAEAVERLAAGGADVAVTAKVIDISARNREDSAESRARNARIAAIQKQRAAERAAAGLAPIAGAAPRARGPPPTTTPATSPSHWAMRIWSARTAASRRSCWPRVTGTPDAAFALIDSGANINQVSAADRTSPILMATINGHFDLAKQLLDRGADVRLVSDGGATPLYGVLNMQWAPKARHPQPADYMQQQTGYLDLAEAFLKAGADVNARLAKSLWYTTYNRDLLGVDRTGATAFWLAAYTLDLPAMKLLLKYGADPNIRTAKVPERYEEGGPDPDAPDKSGLPPVPWGGPAVAPIHAASGVGYGLGFAGNTHRHAPDAWVPAVKFLVEELGADVNARDHNGYTPLHHAAARGDNDLIRYLVSKGADPKALARTGQSTVDLANGPVQRIQPYPETIALLESLGAVNHHRCVSC